MILYEKEENIHYSIITLKLLFSHEAASHSKSNFLFVPLGPIGLLNQTAATLAHLIQKANVAKVEFASL